MDKQYIVVNKDDNKEDNFNTMAEARYHLTRLVMLGISAYIMTVPMYRV